MLGRVSLDPGGGGLFLGQGGSFFARSFVPIDVISLVRTPTEPDWMASEQSNRGDDPRVTQSYWVAMVGDCGALAHADDDGW